MPYHPNEAAGLMPVEAYVPLVAQAVVDGCRAHGLPCAVFQDPPVDGPHADAVAVVALAAAAEAAIMPAPLSISRLSIGHSPWGEHDADRARLAPVRSNVVVGFPQ